MQEFLSENIASLIAEGIIVPDAALKLGNGRSKKSLHNHVPARGDLLNDPPGCDRFELLMTSVLSKSKRASTVILSAENLAENRQAPDFFTALTGNMTYTSSCMSGVRRSICFRIGNNGIQK